MIVVGGYHKEGTIVDQATHRTNHYDSVEFGCFADKWPAKIGLDDTNYIRFGTPLKIVKVPTAAVVAALGIPFSLNENSREVLKRFDFEGRVVGGEILPVYDEKGRVDSVVFSLNDGETAEVPANMLDDVKVEDTTLSEFEKNTKKAAETSGSKSKKNG